MCALNKQYALNNHMRLTNSIYVIKLLNTVSTLEHVLDQHSVVFTSSIGKLKDITAKILVNPEAHPYF